MATHPASPPTMPIASPAGGLQFSVRDLVAFSVTCALYLGWMRFLMAAADVPRPTYEQWVNGAHQPVLSSDLAFKVGLCYWPLPLALMGLLPRRNPGEAAPGLTGYALWRLTGVLYPVAYLSACVLLFPRAGVLWPALVGLVSLAAVWLLATGALIIWECGGSNLPKTRVEWLGLSLYLYLLFGLPASTLLALLG